MPVHDWTRVDDGIFHDFHLEWISSLKQVLNDEVLPDQYYALAEQDAGPGIPDVLALHRKESRRDGGGGTMLAEVKPKVRFHDRAQSSSRLRPRFRRIAIRHVSGDGVVAFIEVVSPGNKSSRKALRKFVEKSTEFIEQNIHLLVLDLIPPSNLNRQGVHPLIWNSFHKVAFTLPMDKPLTLASYNADIDPEAFVEPVAVGDRLPKMPLFLTPEEYVNVPLEQTYQTAWAKVPKRWRDVIHPRKDS